MALSPEELGELTAAQREHAFAVSDAAHEAAKARGRQRKQLADADPWPPKAS